MENEVISGKQQQQNADKSNPNPKHATSESYLKNV